MESSSDPDISTGLSIKHTIDRGIHETEGACRADFNQKNLKGLIHSWWSQSRYWETCKAWPLTPVGPLRKTKKWKQWMKWEEPVAMRNHRTASRSRADCWVGPYCLL